MLFGLERLIKYLKARQTWQVAILLECQWGKKAGWNQVADSRIDPFSVLDYEFNVPLLTQNLGAE